MRPLLAAAFVALGFASWALMTLAEDDGTAKANTSKRFLDNLSVGDRVEIPQFQFPLAGRPQPDEVTLDVLTEDEVKRQSLSPEEASELRALLREQPTEGRSQRQSELAGKASRHPYEVIDVGDDYVGLRDWNANETYIPERRIRSISRRAAQQ